MSIPLSDVQFLKSVVGGLSKDKLNFYKPHANRGAMALVLRFGGDAGIKVARSFSTADRNLTAAEVVARLEHHADAKADSSLQLLLLKKRFMRESRWSGVVAFPGGKRDRADDKNDFACAKRWCDYQLGMPIGTSEFVVLGRLPDFFMYSRAMGKGLMTARFVILHIGELTPSVRLAHHDIEALTWAPLHLFQPANVVRNRERHNLFSYFVNEDYQEFVAQHFPGAKLSFPSISMPDHFGNVWGFTLTSASTLLALNEGHRRRLDWPLFHSDNAVAQMLFVDTLHGYLQVTKNEVVGEPRMQHLFSFGFVVMTALSLVLFALSYVAVIIQALAIAFDEEELMKRRRQVIANYHEPDHAIYRELAVDKDGQLRDRRQQQREAAMGRWVKEARDNVPQDAQGRRFISFTEPDIVARSVAGDVQPVG